MLQPPQTYLRYSPSHERDTDSESVHQFSNGVRFPLPYLCSIVGPGQEAVLWAAITDEHVLDLKAGDCASNVQVLLAVSEFSLSTRGSHGDERLLILERDTMSRFVREFPVLCICTVASLLQQRDSGSCNAEGPYLMLAR